LDIPQFFEELICVGLNLIGDQFQERRLVPVQIGFLQRVVIGKPPFGVTRDISDGITVFQK
jgi:hypothetical protein